MKRHILWGKLGESDIAPHMHEDDYTQVTVIELTTDQKTLNHGLGATLKELLSLGLKPSEIGIDLVILATIITAADTKISRKSESQDTWTREIDIWVPVSEPEKWETVNDLIRNMLKFLTGDIWRIKFRRRPNTWASICPKNNQLALKRFTSVSLFSGGLDSYIGAIDLLAEGIETPLLVSHYWDQSTFGQPECAENLKKEYSSLDFSHIRTRVGFNKGTVKHVEGEDTLRARSFLFFALGSLAASSSDNIETLYVPENGLISLNVPLDPLRLGAWSTRTTHPYYLARWNELLDKLGLKTTLKNPYRFKTKGEMVAECENSTLLKNTYRNTLSCASVSKGRWDGYSTGHCGHCVPCIIRRASITHAYREDLSGYQAVPEFNAATCLDSKKAEGIHVRSFQYMKRQLSKSANQHKILVHKSGPLSDYPQTDINEYAEVFRRGIEEVDAILKDVTVKPL